MGSDICCRHKENSMAKVTIVTVQKSQKQQLTQTPFDDSSSSTSQIPQTTPALQSPPSLKKVQSMGFNQYVRQIQLDISSIKKISSSHEEECSEQKNIINYLEKLQQQIQRIRQEKDLKLCSQLLEQNSRQKFDEKRFIEHSLQCQVCFQLYENIKNMENQENSTVKQWQLQREDCASLRDSLLKFVQDEKQKHSAQTKCQVLNSNQLAKKTMKKFPNTNKYQSKRLKFRKASTFQPQIKQTRQSDESMTQIKQA